MEISEYVLWVALGFGPTLGALEIALRSSLKKAAMAGRKVSAESRSPSSFIGKKSGIEEEAILSVR